MTEQLFNAIAFLATAATLAIVWQMKAEIKTIRERLHVAHCTLMEFYVNTLSQQIAEAKRNDDTKTAETLEMIQSKTVALMKYLADEDGDSVQHHQIRRDDDNDSSTAEVSSASI